MVEHVKENIIVYVSTTIIASLFIFFGISFMELRNDVRDIRSISQENTILIREMKDKFSGVSKNKADIIAMKSKMDTVDMIFTNWFFNEKD